MLILTPLVLISHLYFNSEHYTKYSGTVASKISSILGHVKQGMLWSLHTHTVGNLQTVLDVTTKCTDTSKTALVWDNKISYLLTLLILGGMHHMLLVHVPKPVVSPLQHALVTRMTLQ